MNGNIDLPFFGAILPENRPEVNNALERKTRSFAGLSIDLIIAENRPAINHVFNRCYKFLTASVKTEWYDYITKAFSGHKNEWYLQ